MKYLWTEINEPPMIVCLQESGHLQWDQFQVSFRDCIDRLCAACKQVLKDHVDYSDSIFIANVNGRGKSSCR